MALEDVTLKLEPGKLVALVGLSGSGKSTLVALLQRLYDPGSGQVRFAALAASRMISVPSECPQNALSCRNASSALKMFAGRSQILKGLEYPQNALRLPSKWPPKCLQCPCNALRILFRNYFHALKMLSSCCWLHLGKTTIRCHCIAGLGSYCWSLLSNYSLMQSLSYLPALVITVTVHTSVLMSMLANIVLCEQLHCWQMSCSSAQPPLWCWDCSQSS